MALKIEGCIASVAVNLDVVWGVSWFDGADLVHQVEAARSLLFADSALTRKVAVVVGIVGNAVFAGIAVVFAVVVAVLVVVVVVVVAAVVVVEVLVLEVVIVVAADVKAAAVVEVVAVVVADAGVVVDDECIPEHLRCYFYREQSARLDCNVLDSGEDDRVAADENRSGPFGSGTL